MDTPPHDPEVMDNHQFFSRDVSTHLARKRLTDLFDAKTHWALAITPECMTLIWQLGQLHRERCGEGIDLLVLRSQPMRPIVCTLPRDQFTLDDILELIGPVPCSREVLEEKAWITLSSVEVEAVMDAVTTWVNVDHLLN
jgi:hypothetical protein